jgi:hypothetical protein
VTTGQLGFDCDPDWDGYFDDNPEDDEDDEDTLPADLRGQSLPAGAEITDVPLTGRYL